MWIAWPKRSFGHTSMSLRWTTECIGLTYQNGRQKQRLFGHIWTDNDVHICGLGNCSNDLIKRERGCFRCWSWVFDEVFYRPCCKEKNREIWVSQTKELVFVGFNLDCEIWDWDSEIFFTSKENRNKKSEASASNYIKGAAPSFREMSALKDHVKRNALEVFCASRVFRVLCAGHLWGNRGKVI